MALKTTLEQLEEVQAAITRILTAGQEHAFGTGHSTREAQLVSLHAREKVLLQRYKAETGTSGPRINVGIVRKD